MSLEYMILKVHKYKGAIAFKHVAYMITLIDLFVLFFFIHTGFNIILVISL